jgi:hypothetical protein
MSRLQTVLADVEGVDSRVYRSRQEAVTREESPVLLFESVNSTLSEPYTTPHIGWILTVRFTIIAREDESGTKPDIVADATLEDMHSLILGDATLDGLCISIYPKTINYQFVEADNNAVAVICDYEFQYRTSLLDLSVVS